MGSPEPIVAPGVLTTLQRRAHTAAMVVRRGTCDNRASSWLGACRDGEFSTPSKQSNRLGAYEALQPPLYYWIAAPLLWLLRGASLATQAFGLRWASVVLGSLVIPLMFVLARKIFRDDRAALGCALVVALMPELAV